MQLFLKTYVMRMYDQPNNTQKIYIANVMWSPIVDQSANAKGRCANIYSRKENNNGKEHITNTSQSQHDHTKKWLQNISSIFTIFNTGLYVQEIQY